MTGVVHEASFVWSGRTPDVPGGHDGWNTDPRDLATLVAGAHEIVITDPLSFPWRYLRAGTRAIPLTAHLPAELGPEEIGKVLGKPLLRHVTRYDRLVDDRDDVRQLLSSAWDLPAGVWAPPADADVRERVEGKGRLYEVVEVIRRGVSPAVTDREAPPLVGFLADASEVAGPVAAWFLCPHARYDLEPGDDDPPAPHVLVVWLADGGQSQRDRLALLSRARELLHPGGRLVVVGYAVTRPGGATNPRISTLVEELAEAFGGMIHVDEVQAVRWRGESLSRGVLLAGSSLAGGRI